MLGGICGMDSGRKRITKKGDKKANHPETHIRRIGVGVLYGLQPS